MVKAGARDRRPLRTPILFFALMGRGSVASGATSGRGGSATRTRRFGDKSLDGGQPAYSPCARSTQSGFIAPPCPRHCQRFFDREFFVARYLHSVSTRKSSSDAGLDLCFLSLHFHSGRFLAGVAPRGVAYPPACRFRRAGRLVGGPSPNLPCSGCDHPGRVFLALSLRKV